MLKSLNTILDIQNLDIKMIRLARVKRQRQKEFSEIEKLTEELKEQMIRKESEIEEMGAEITLHETQIQELKEKIKLLEAKQSQVKKIDEFNALTQELNQVSRDKSQQEQDVSDLLDKKVAEEEILDKIKESLASSEESGKELKKEILSGIAAINEEGKKLKDERDVLAEKADPKILAVYERLLNNKKDRVVVPLVDRICTGCNVQLTAQHENLVRKGEKLIFCEHCSRIHYWQESEDLESDSKTTRRRRRRTASV